MKFKALFIFILLSAVLIIIHLAVENRHLKVDEAGSSARIAILNKTISIMDDSAHYQEQSEASLDKIFRADILMAAEQGYVNGVRDEQDHSNIDWAVTTNEVWQKYVVQNNL
jgi:hypothetical protein